MDPRISDGLCKCLIVKGGRVAQLVEQCPFKAWVAGSNPAALTRVYQYFVDAALWNFGPVRSNFLTGGFFHLSISPA